MGNILDKLGIYDLFVIFLSGAIITYVTSCVCEKFLIVEFPISVNETMTFLVFSFIIGTIFQEVGSWIFRKFFDKNRKMLEAIFQNTKDKSISLIKKEREGLLVYFKRKNIDDKEMMYNYCKYKLLESGIHVNGDNNQSISGLSRSLALYCWILWVFFFDYNLQTWNREYFGYLIVCTFLGVLFKVRCIRFIKMRYVNIFRLFYYKYVVDEKITLLKIEKH